MDKKVKIVVGAKGEKIVLLGIKKETSSPLAYILYGENPSLL